MRLDLGGTIKQKKQMFSIFKSDDFLEKLFWSLVTSNDLQDQAHIAYNTSRCLVFMSKVVSRPYHFAMTQTRKQKAH